MSAPAEQVAEGIVGLVSASITDAPLTKALNYVASHGPADANRASETARVILGVVAANRNPRDFGKVDYVGRLRTYYNPNNGNYDPSTDSNSLSILALVAAKEPVPEHAVAALRDRACSDGGFPKGTCLFGSDVTSTSLVLQALVAAGVGPSDPSYAKARSYLVAAQNAQGGFGPSTGQATESLPTAAAVAAIIAMGEDAAAWRKSPTADPVAALLTLQDASGGFRAAAATAAPDELTTARVLPGLAGRPLPVRPAAATPATTTTVAGGPPSTTATTKPPASGTSAPGVGAARTVLPAATSTTTNDSTVSLAAPTSGGDNGQRSLLRLLPFVATLFGAGTVGLALRRRART
jgi:hypothetical protein